MFPHGLLHYLPLHALFAENKRLIEHFSIVYSPSLTVLKYSQSKPTRKFESCLSIGYTPNEREKEIFEGEAKLVAKEWLKNNFKFSLWGWLYNSIPPNNHQRQYR